MDTCGKEQENTIQEQVEELRELLRILLLNIDTLVERNPRPPTESDGVEQRPDNVFDEILLTIGGCRKLTTEATKKVQDGISRKVH